jgi:dTDP-4-dehydrorhamnose reductase
MAAISGLKGRVVLVGANGMLGRMVQKLLPKGLELICYDLPDFDMTDQAQVSAAISLSRPDIVINCAAYTAVDACEDQEELATRVNALGVAHLAWSARELDATLVHISTDYVFAGDQQWPYREDDATGPVSAYGRSKLKGEQAILESGLEKFFIIRTSWLYGPWGGNFVETILRLAAERQELRIVADQVGSPTYTADLGKAIFQLLAVAANPHSAVTSPYGIYHFASEGCCSWYEFACAIVAEGRRLALPFKVREIHPVTTEDYPLPARRPANSVFDKAKYKAATGAIVPDWRESLIRYLSTR